MSVIARNFLRRPKPKRVLEEFASDSVLWGELLSNDIAERDAEMRAAQTNPPDQVLENLEFLAHNVIDVVRREVGRVRIVAGYRCPKLQDMVLGQRGSAITKGLGVELQVEDVRDLKPSVISEALADVPGKELKVSPTWYLSVWLMHRLDKLPIESISVDGGDKGLPVWVTVSAHPDPTRQRGAITAFGPWTNGETVKLHPVDLRNLGVV